LPCLSSAQPLDVSAGTELAGAWRVESGELVGQPDSSGPAVWRTAGDYFDFDFEAEFKVEGSARGGLLYRGHWLPAISNDAVGPEVVYGYEAAIDTASPAKMGSLANIQEPGSHVAAAEDAHAAFQPGEWNVLKVSARGAVSEVQLNGVTAAVLSDEATIGGFVGLRVDEGTIAFRKMRIADAGRSGTWRPLFDGQSLEGWKNWGSESWTVSDGVIQGRRGPKESEGYLATVETWKDFRVRGEARMLGAGNYGLFYHSSIRLREDGYPLISGVQGEVEPSYPGSTGWHYESYRRGWIIQPKKKSPAAYALRPDQWNAIEIRSLGNHVTSWVNGFRVLDFHDATPQLFEGSFALQLHTGEGAGIDWRALYVEE